jgi:hypothetical protein
VLLSRHRKAWAWSSLRGHPARLANDGSLATRWIAHDTTYPKRWTVDLGHLADVSRVKIVWPGTRRSYAYRIKVSIDGERYSTVLDRGQNTIVGRTSDAVSARARFVRIRVIGVSPAGGRAASITEVEVWGRR